MYHFKMKRKREGEHFLRNIWTCFLFSKVINPLFLKVLKLVTQKIVIYNSCEFNKKGFILCVLCWIFLCHANNIWNSVNPWERKIKYRSNKICFSFREKHIILLLTQQLSCYSINVKRNKCVYISDSTITLHTKVINCFLNTKLI